MWGKNDHFGCFLDIKRVLLVSLSQTCYRKKAQDLARPVWVTKIIYPPWVKSKKGFFIPPPELEKWGEERSLFKKIKYSKTKSYIQ